jgi:hypothetical protein
VSPAAIEEKAIAKVEFSLDATGGVTDQPHLLEPSRTLTEDAYARAAIRAVMRCGPYTMAPGQKIAALFKASAF